jgi:hypothetical protein
VVNLLFPPLAALLVALRDAISGGLDGGDVDAGSDIGLPLFGIAIGLARHGGWGRRLVPPSVKTTPWAR